MGVRFNPFTSELDLVDPPSADTLHVLKTGDTMTGDLSLTGAGVVFNTAQEGLTWAGGSQIYEQTSTARMLFLPNGDRFEVLTESGAAFIAGFHGSTSSLGASIRLYNAVGIGNVAGYAQSGTLPSNGLVVSGKTGLGVTSPSYQLHVSNATDLIQAQFVGGGADVGTNVRIGNTTSYPNYVGTLFGTSTYAGQGFVMRDNANQFTSIGGSIRFQTSAINTRKNIAYTSKADATKQFNFTADADAWSIPPGSTFTVGANTYTVRSAASDRIRVMEDISAEAATGTLTGLLYAPIRMLLDTSGNLGIGTAAPSTLLDVNADKFRVRTAKTPASATDTGNAGDICWDADYVYVCVATNTWKRSPLTTW